MVTGRRRHPAMPCCSRDTVARLVPSRDCRQSPEIIELQMTGVQRKEPVAAGGRTHAEWHEAVVGFDDRSDCERWLYEVQRS